ncbi:MAG: hypothetical protein JNM40_08275 [Myxococcales bacterium]|nr:hypothetical protein [Myxococcales bacterium]
MKLQHHHRLNRSLWGSILLGLWLTTISGSVLAQPVCDDPKEVPNPVYLTVGDTQVNLMRELGAKLRQSEQVTLVFRATGSCTNLDTLYGDLRMSGNFSYIPAGYDPKKSPTLPVCTLPAPGVLTDIANSIVFLDSCPTPKPADVIDVLGPVQSFVFAVPLASSQTAITAEEAYFVFGFGMAGQVFPWLDNNLLFGRPVTKGTVISVGASIGVPAGKWQGQKINLSQDLASMLAAAADPNRALGVLGSEVYDGYRSTLKALAFRAYRQSRAYWPDATQSSFDKQNVRDGHYHLWSYTHWLQRVDDKGMPRSVRAQRVIDLLVGNAVTPASGFEPLESSVRVGLVPRCAMTVQRSSEGGDFSLYQAPQPCGCFFEYTATGKTKCQSCVDSTTCGGGTCRHGFCEER